MSELKTYYVYAWYLRSTGKVFHIGKGTGNRYLDTTHSRNSYFKNIIQKYPKDVAVQKLYDFISFDAVFCRFLQRRANGRANNIPKWRRPRHVLASFSFVKDKGHGTDRATSTYSS